MEFLVMAYDGKDPDAKARRVRARQAHLDGVRGMKEVGTFINGGAILDDNGEMVGSTLYMDFPSRTALDQWLASDPICHRRCVGRYRSAADSFSVPFVISYLLG